jgi:hypothetical protein
MIEAVFSILLVSGVFVAALHTLGASTVAQGKFGNRGRGHMLALDLMNEILQCGYADPNETVVFGLESSENAAQRSTFDDVDDYRNYSESPLANRAGVTIAGFTGWTRTVSVEKVAASNLTLISTPETGVKRITVKVARHGVIVASLTAVKADKQPAISPT